MPKAFSAASKARAHCGAVGDVGFDGNRLAAFGLDVFFERLQAIRPARHQRDRGAVIGQRLGELRAQAAGGAGHQRHAAFQIEHIGGFHSQALYTPRATI